MSNNEINDKRSQKDFKGITFSKYKRSDVKKELLNSLINGKLESSCYWSAEFICSGNFLELWEVIILFISKNIHLGNPTIPRYIDLRYNNFKRIVTNGYIGRELTLRNHNKIRILFAEIICILCLSTKKHPYSKIKIKPEDFETFNLTDKLKAKKITYAQSIFKNGDPKEFYISLNELAYNISIKNTSMACYWIEWILEFETLSKKKKNIVFTSIRRDFIPVDNKYQMDIIWIVWELFIHLSLKFNYLKDTIKSLLNIFCIRYKSGVKKKRRYVLYYAISLLTETYNIQTPLFTENKKIESIKKKINIIYGQIKKNEIKPQTDYLFNNSICEKTKNLENTLSKLDKMENITGFIPRIN